MTAWLSSACDGFAASWWAWCVPAAWHATWFALAGLVLERALRERLAPAYRAIPWWLFFACFALPPGLVSPFAAGVRELAAPPELTNAFSSVAAAPLATEAGGTSAASLARVAALVWLGGVLFALVRLARDQRTGVAALRASSRPAPRVARARLARLVRGARLTRRERARLELAVTPGLASPLLSGIFHCTIHVPERLLERPRELEHALRHELAHFARRDPLRALAVELCAALVWFHPFARLAVRRLGQARELACDARVARALVAERSAACEGGLDAYRATLARAALERDDPRLALAPGFAVGRRFSGAQEFLGRARVVERLRALERAPRFSPWVHALSASLLFACATATLVPARMTPDRAFAERVLAASAAGEKVSCFTLHAAALALRDELPSPDSPSPDPTE